MILGHQNVPLGSGITGITIFVSRDLTLFSLPQKRFLFYTTNIDKKHKPNKQLLQQLASHALQPTRSECISYRQNNEQTTLPLALTFASGQQYSTETCVCVCVFLQSVVFSGTWRCDMYSVQLMVLGPNPGIDGKGLQSTNLMGVILQLVQL